MQRPDIAQFTRSRPDLELLGFIAYFVFVHQGMAQATFDTMRHNLSRGDSNVVKRGQTWSGPALHSSARIAYGARVNGATMTDIPVEKKFATLCEITRAQHFAWREAVQTVCPDVDPKKVVDAMWRVTGRGTARSYLKRVDKDKPLAPQIAASIAWSSQSMGEEAAVEGVDGKDEAFVRHRDCPWRHWHVKLGLESEDRAGCDAWFQATVDEINKALGTRLRVETLETLPEGAPSCLRRFWVE